MLLNALSLFAYAAAEWDSDSVAISFLSEATEAGSKFLDLFPKAMTPGFTTVLDEANLIVGTMVDDYWQMASMFHTETPSAELLSAYQASVTQLNDIFALVENVLGSHVAYADLIGDYFTQFYDATTYVIAYRMMDIPDNCYYYDNVFAESIGDPLNSVFEKVGSYFSWTFSSPSCTPTIPTTHSLYLSRDVSLKTFTEEKRVSSATTSTTHSTATTSATHSGTTTSTTHSSATTPTTSTSSAKDIFSLSAVVLDNGTITTHFSASPSTTHSSATSSPSSTYRCLVRPTGTEPASTSAKYLY